MSEEPFILSKRKNSPYYQVRFKSQDSKQRYLPAKSTKETVRSKALVAAWKMYNEEEVKKKSLIEQVKSAEFDDNEVQQFLEALKKKGVVKSFVLEQEAERIAAEQFFSSFWDVEKSPYISEKRRMGKHIGLTYIYECNRDILKYWLPFFKGRYLNEITKRDIKDFVERLEKEQLSWSRKLKIYRSGATALKWAYNDELIDRDITSGLSSFSGTTKERKILTKELAELLFSIEWEDERCKLINLIAMLTGMRAGEILALRKMDLGKDCIYVNHSWNRREGLKTPKNGETRIVFFPFPNIIKLILKDEDNMEDFIFPAPLTANKPMDIKLPNEMLKRQLLKIGLSKSEAKNYCFHSWRHFYTTYMSERVNDRILQKQTGHKTLKMLEHYGNHRVDEDFEIIKAAQLESFGNIIQEYEDCRLY